ncbi:penicillin-binding transpeptidase domain-containing protein [Nocardioides sp.]|uniref:penicillin-binding transpeptidase domain-containing protein n=1 Tax=Nocardioides sp. TaxID=35761 RepID=UPI003527DC00
MRAARVAAVAAALLAGSLAGCSGGDTSDQPDPATTVDALARALGDGDLTGVSWTADTAAEAQPRFDAIVEGMGDLQPTVQPGRVTEQPAADGEPATARAALTWHWPVGDNEWVYDAEASLTLADGGWQVAWEPAVVEPSLRGKVVLDAHSLRPGRGDVVGYSGLKLITARDVVRFGVDRSLVPRATAVASARQLARLVDIDVPSYVDRVRSAGDLAFVEAITYRREEVPETVGAGYESLEGVRALQTTAELGPTPTFGQPLLGRVGEVTAEMIDADPGRYQVGDLAGLSGLEARYDDQLRGQPGLAVDAVATDGKSRELYAVPATDGDPLLTSMDLDLQLEAEQLLADQGPPSGLVAIRPSTGAVLAAATSPSADGVNIATFGKAAPGSTFKIVSSLALIRSGLTPESKVPCTPSVLVDGKVFANYDAYPPAHLGRIPLWSALAHSCNTAFISQHGRLGTSDLADAAASLGFGIDHEVGYPAYFGQVTPTDNTTEAAADLIGQGTVLAAPLSMATVVASIQAGHTVVPTLVKGVSDEAAAAAPPLTEQEAEQLRSMMRHVVTDGTANQLRDIPGPPVIGKTGTAEFDQNGKRLTHAWMVAAQGDLAVAVYVDVGNSGSGIAGPILEAFLRAARG